DNLLVLKENMLRNLEKSRGMVFSQGLLLKLVEKGLTREEGYALVQNAARKVWEDEDITLKEAVLSDVEIRHHLKPSEIDDVFDYAYHLKNVDKIFKRVGINGKAASRPVKVAR